MRGVVQSVTSPQLPLRLSGSRREEMEEQFERFLAEHPIVWELFVRFTMQRIYEGFEHYSVNGIFERIRWETDKAKVDQTKEFKLNNNLRPFFARRFMSIWPEHDGFFRTRKQISEAMPASNLPPLGPGDFA